MKETKKNGAAQSKAGKRDYSAFKNMYRKIPQDLRDVIVYYIGDRPLVIHEGVNEVTGEVVTAEFIRQWHMDRDREVYNNNKHLKPPADENKKKQIREWEEAHPGEKCPDSYNLSLDASFADDEGSEDKSTATFNLDTSAPTFKSPALLSKTDIEKMLPTLNRIESWIEAIFAYVSSEAINHGVAWDGYKVVEGRSKRQFLDTKSVVAAAEKAGYTDIYKTELISLTEFEKLMGKKKFKEILGEYVVKPPGKLALVPNSDPREAVNLETAEDEFTPLD